MLLISRLFHFKRYPFQNEILKSSNNKITVFKGIALAVLSGICFSTAAVIVKKVSNISEEQLAVYRFIAITTFSMPDAIKSGKNLTGPPGFFHLLVLRGLFGASNIVLSFVAFRNLPLGDASVIIFSVPIFVTVAARIFLKEKCGFSQSIAVFLTIFGIICTTKLPVRFSGTSSYVYTKDSIIGFMAAAGSVFFNTCRYIVMRKLKPVHHSVIVFSSSSVSILEATILTGIFGTYKWHSCGIEQYYIILLGLVSFIGQILLTMALQCEQAGPVATMRAATDIALGFIWQIIIFNNNPDAYSISGAVLVVFSAVLIAMRKWVVSLPHESSAFKNLRWLTI